MQEGSIVSNTDQVKPYFKEKQSPSTFQSLQENVIILQKDDVKNNNNNNNMTPNIKLPLTMVGNVTLSKGMYLALMKRREQKAFGNTSYSSTPRLSSTQNKIQSNKQYHSCARINIPSNSKLNQSSNSHDFKNLKSNKQNSLKKQTGREDAYLLRSMVKKDQNNKYKEIHKTKKIEKERNKKSPTQKRKRKHSNTSENEAEFILKDITRSQNSNSQIKQKSEKGCKDKKVSTQKSISKSKNTQPQKKNQMQTMRERSKLYQRDSQIKKTEQNSKISNNSNQNSRISDSNGYQDKENQQMSSNISYASSSGDSNIYKNNELNPFSGFHQSTSMWHEEAIDMQTERAMFIQKLKKDKKKKYSQSPKRIVPGFRVKFETSKNKIYSFNCFRDKDLGFDKQHRDTIDLEQDNDYETDCEQIKESILNVFQSLCVAVCEEKINQQIYGKTQSNIY